MIVDEVDTGWTVDQKALMKSTISATQYWVYSIRRQPNPETQIRELLRTAID